MRSIIGMPSDDLAGALFKRACRYLEEEGLWSQRLQEAVLGTKGKAK